MESSDVLKTIFGVVTFFILYKLVFRYAFSRKAKEIEAPKTNNDNSGSMNFTQNTLTKSTVSTFMSYVDNFMDKWRSSPCPGSSQIVQSKTSC